MTADRITALEEALREQIAFHAMDLTFKRGRADDDEIKDIEYRRDRARAALAASRAAPDCHQPDLVTAAQVRVTALEQALKYIADMKPHHAGQSGNEYRMQQAAKAVLAVCPICDIAGCQHVLGEAPAVEPVAMTAQDASQVPEIAEVNDGRPCVTDVFLAAAIDQLEDKWDFFEAVKDWCEGDWSGALVGVDIPALRAIGGDA